MVLTIAKQITALSDLSFVFYCLMVGSRQILLAVLAMIPLKLLVRSSGRWWSPPRFDDQNESRRNAIASIESSPLVARHGSRQSPRVNYKPIQFVNREVANTGITLMSYDSAV
jgi:hypothetical protein